MRTAITELFDIDHPIIQGGMHFVGFADSLACLAVAFSTFEGSYSYAVYTLGVRTLKTSIIC